MSTVRYSTRGESSLVRALSEPPPLPPEAGGPVPPTPRRYLLSTVIAAAVMVAAVVSLHFDFVAASISGGLAAAGSAATLVCSFLFVRAERWRSILLERSAAALRVKVRGVLERDWLTGLITEEDFWRVLQREINRSKRYGRVCSTVAVEVDLDAFLASSHHAQNADPAHLARHLADMVRASVRESDTVARRSGVFGLFILLPETPAEGAAVVAERLKLKMEQNPIQLLDGANVPLAFRSVVVSYPAHGDSANEVESALRTPVVPSQRSAASGA